jgi:hypothetical protein
MVNSNATHGMVQPDEALARSLFPAVRARLHAAMRICFVFADQDVNAARRLTVWSTETARGKRLEGFLSLISLQGNASRGPALSLTSPLSLASRSCVY